MSYFVGFDNSNAVGAEIGEAKDGRLLLSHFGGKAHLHSQFGIPVIFIIGHCLSEASSDRPASPLWGRLGVQFLRHMEAPFTFPMLALTPLEQIVALFFCFPYLTVSFSRLGTVPVLYSTMSHHLADYLAHSSLQKYFLIGQKNGMS